MAGVLDRTMFQVNRDLEFFSEKELQMQIGHGQRSWPVALAKELIDNALDALDSLDGEQPRQPQVMVQVLPDALVVQDNGPGMPVATLQRSLDYRVRVSDKVHYVSPTRGQMGNALKCVWAAPFVMDGEYGCVEITTGGQVYQVEVTLDRIAQQPRLEMTTSLDGLVKNGTLVKMHWPDLAGYLAPDGYSSFYRSQIPDLSQLVSNYAAFNPHVRFLFKDENHDCDFSGNVAEGWKKWRPGNPTSVHWYTPERFRSLIAAYVSEERDGGKAKTVREFVSEFYGLSGTAKQKRVTEQAGMPGAYLRDLVDGDDISLEQAAFLLGIMRQESRVIKPAVLGVLGEDFFQSHMISRGADQEKIRYKKKEGLVQESLPYVLEAALGPCEDYDRDRELAIGLNWSPVLKFPLDRLSSLLGEHQVEYEDPLLVVIHLACPRLEYTDRGKSTLALPEEMEEDLEQAIRSVAQDWRAAKKKADREGRMARRQLKEFRTHQRREELSMKEAAYQVMERAYLKASGNGAYPANARQVMYAARPWVLEMTGGKCWSSSAYFTQHILPDYLDENPVATRQWDVVFDARGHIIEPHTRKSIGLGTVEVRQYIGSWTDFVSDTFDPLLFERDIETRGPGNRYRYALFVEKEGFFPLLERADIAACYDIAIMSTKGMSVTAARQLVEELTLQDVTTLVIRDFDKTGFSIVHSLTHDTRRWRFSVRPRVIDMGLRLDDVQRNQLESEEVTYSAQTPRSCHQGQLGSNCCREAQFPAILILRHVEKRLELPFYNQFSDMLRGF